MVAEAAVASLFHFPLACAASFQDRPESDLILSPYFFILPSF
jgi:hypothetical protein